MKSLLHLMKSSFAPNFPPGQSRTPRRERSQKKQCSIPVACKMSEWNVGSLCESSLYTLAPNCHQAKKLISKSIRWVRTGSWPIMAYIMFHFYPQKDLTVSLKTFSSWDLIYYTFTTKNNYFEIHLCYNMYLQLISFYCQIVCHTEIFCSSFMHWLSGQ